ncbi:MAG: hypothetical protein LBK61_07970 [Spirochaetaceae bacterium]|jgi:hypothetical protein|nr:hypothetical protein [Spirochaetaceae bacterium]
MDLEEIKSYFKEELKKTKETVDRVEYTKETYLNLFGEEEQAETVLGTVLISRNQFQKLQDRDRTGYLGAMAQTLKIPDIIVKDGDNSWLYVKTFKKTTTDGLKTFIGVVVQKGPKKYLVSLHQKDLNNVLNKIKKVGDIIYPDRTKASGANQSLDTLSPDSGEKSSPENDPAVYFQLTREG